MNNHHYPVTCTGCGTPYPLSWAELQTALLVQPEGFYCVECSARLAAAPSFAGWLDSEWERQREETP